MKTIQSITVWYNGEEQQATVLSAVASNDNLIDSASFTYQLLKQGEQTPMNYGLIPLVSGSLTMTGDAYQSWQTNQYAYDWVAEQLNLTITGDYIPPVPPEPTPEPIVEA